MPTIWYFRPPQLGVFRDIQDTQAYLFVSNGQVEEAKLEFDTGANRGDEMDGEVGSGAQIAWNTGLAEIALPIEFKLK